MTGVVILFQLDPSFSRLYLVERSIIEVMMCVMWEVCASHDSVGFSRECGRGHFGYLITVYFTSCT